MPDDLEKSLDYFNQAIDLDPNYALAYSGLADGFIIQGNFSIVHPSETYPKAKTAAIKAVTLDENLAGAHNSLAFTMFFSDWDWIGAEREFRRAITLNPGDALAHSWYALFLTAMGRFGEANEASTKAMELDPLSPVILANRGLELYMGKKYDLSIEQNRKTLEINPLFHAAYITLGGAYVQKKMYTDAIVTFSKASLFSKGHPIPVAALGYAYAVSGKHEDAMMMLELLLGRSENEYVSPYWIAIVYIGLGDKDQAFRWMEKAYQEKDGTIAYLNVIPIFDNLRSDERFISLIHKLKLKK